MHVLAAPLSRRHSRGFTLVEIMVGVAIGLIGIVAIFQAVATWSKHYGGDELGWRRPGCRHAGAVQHRARREGGRSRLRTCDARRTWDAIVNATDTTPARVFNFQMAPVQIAAGAGGAPDQITILYGDSSFHAGDDPNISTGSADFSAATATSKTLLRRGGFKPGDFAIAAYNPGALPGSAQCQLLQITADTNPDGRTVDHTTAPFTSFYTGGPAVASRFNSAVAPLAVGGKMYNLGPDPRLNVWSIQNNGRVLTQTDVIHNTAPLQVAESVVNLKARVRGRPRRQRNDLRCGVGECPAGGLANLAGDPGRGAGAEPQFRAQRRPGRNRQSAPRRRPPPTLITSATPWVASS